MSYSFSMSSAPYPVPPGGDVEVSLVIGNPGTSDGHLIKAKISCDGLLDSPEFECQRIPAGGSVTLTVKTRAFRGPYVPVEFSGSYDIFMDDGRRYSGSSTLVRVN